MEIAQCRTAILQRPLSPTCGSHLHCHGEVAGFGVPDNAGVHGWLDAPAPLQVAHGVLVQVAGQHRGEAGADPAGGELQGTVCGDETREMRKNSSVKQHRLPAGLAVFLAQGFYWVTKVHPAKCMVVEAFREKEKLLRLPWAQQWPGEQAVPWFIVCAWCCPGTQPSPVSAEQHTGLLAQSSLAI